MITDCTKRIIHLSLVVLCIISFSATPIFAQNDSGDEVEVYLSFRHRGIINTVLVSYYKDERFFLPVNELLEVFQVDVSTEGLVSSGKFSTSQTPYSIDLNKQKIIFGKKEILLNQDDFILGDLDNYLPTEMWKRIFDLEFNVDFNNLTLHLETMTELPVIAKAIREQRRRIADANRFETPSYPLSQGRNVKMLDGGFADYGITINKNQNTESLLYNTSVGLQVAGGDLQGTLYGNLSDNGLTNSTNNLRWRYFIRDSKYISKVTVGQTTLDGALSNPYTGIRITNEPIEPRRLYDEFEIQGNTLPNSEVEVYLNNALIDFAESDEIGNYRFITPLFYGSSQIDLRVYGPTGQVITQTSRVQVPFTFVPKGEYTYRFNAGRLNNPVIGSTEKNLAVQGNIAYGLTNWLTSKVGIEYYKNGLEKDAPSLATSLSARLLTNYLLTVEAITNAYYRAAVNTVFPNSASFSLDYTNFIENTNIYNTSGNDQQLIASVYYPFQIKGLPLNIRASTFTRYRDSNQNSTLRFDLSTRITKINLRLAYSERLFNSYVPFRQNSSAYLESSATYNFSNSRNIPKLIRGAFLRAQMRYIPSFSQVENTEFLISKNLFRNGRMQISFGRNFLGGYNLFRFNFIIDLNKVRSNTTVNSVHVNYSVSQNVRGSIGYDTNYHNFIATSRDQVGRSAAAIRLFVDNNNDDIYDNTTDEEISEGSVRIGRGGSSSIEKNGVIYYTQMQPYYRYNLELNKGSIKNPMLVPGLDKFSVITDPNSFKKIEIPFYMSGVIEGQVERYNIASKQKNGIGGLKLHLRSIGSDYTKEIRTFSDGSFYDYEIPPGKYELTVESSSLEKLNVKSNPGSIEFEVKAIPEGDFIEGLYLELVPLGFDIEEEPEDPITEPSSQSSSSGIPGVGMSETSNDGGGISIEYSLPVTELEKNKCRYGFQLGAYSSYAKANEAAATLPVDTYVIYNSARQLYAIRSGLYQSLASTAKSMKEISGNTPSDASVLNQCYGTVASNYQPGSNLYHLQFGAFSNRIRANLFSKQINEQFGLKSFVAQDEKDMLYKVRLGPFESKNEANRERSDMLSNTSIRQLYISESEGGARMINVDFEYMLQLGEFPDKEKALLYAIRIESEFDVKSKIVIDENESVVLFVNKAFINWDEILSLKNKISADATFEKPILHLYEKKIEEVSLLERPSDELRKPFIEIVREN